MRKKYFTESILNIYSSGPLLLPPSELYNINSLDEKMGLDLHQRNIYLITKRPRISIIPDTLNYTDNKLFMQLKIHLKGKEIIKDISQEYYEDIIFKVSDFPHTKLLIYDKKNNLLSEISTLYIVGQLNNIFYGHNNLEVVYIGQSFGKGGERSAVDRLSSHSTLQKILSNISEKEPNMEVILALYKFEFHQFMFIMDGRNKDTIKVTKEEDQVHYQEIMKSNYTRQMNISLVEAGLIRYFEPKYNKIYKDGFPYKKYKILDKLYELDFAGLSIEINSDEMNAKLFSNKTNVYDHHICNYDLHSLDYRKEFFFNPL